MITWDKMDERYFEHGLDRGVLYLPDTDPIPWNGLTGFDEGEGATSSILYRDGVIYLADVAASDFSGKLNCMFFPDEFRPCIGMPEVVEGFYVDNQKPTRFSFAYRSLIGSGLAGDMFGYQIHVVYNAIAAIAPRSRKTLGGDSAPVDFEFDLVCTPEKLVGYRPSSHYMVDTRGLASDRISEIEGLLYGTETTPGRLPTPAELKTMVEYGLDDIIEPILEPV